jgi:hypothetical protein
MLFESISLRDCSFPFDETISYRIKKIHMVVPSHLRGFALQNYCYVAMNLLIPAHLRYLRLDAPFALKNFIDLLVTKDRFTFLDAAELVVPTGRTCPKLAPFLTCCPNLKRLVLHVDVPGSNLFLKDASIKASNTTITEVEVHGTPLPQKDVVAERMRALFPRATRVEVFSSSK